VDLAETLKKMTELQATDSGLDELERIRKGFSHDLVNLDADLAALKARIQAEKSGLENLQKERKNLEIEAGALENRIAKYLSQQNDVKSNEQFAALKQEIEKSKEEKARLEEKILEGLFQEDEGKKQVQKLTQDLVNAEKRVAAEKQGIQQKIADCEKARQDKKMERAKQLADLPEDYADGYEKLRNNGKKIAVAEVREDQTCSGCHMNIPPQILNEIRKNIAIQRCNCGRYLSVGN
jgi:uncharacterized protein